MIANFELQISICFKKYLNTYHENFTYSQSEKLNHEKCNYLDFFSTHNAPKNQLENFKKTGWKISKKSKKKLYETSEKIFLKTAGENFFFLWVLALKYKPRGKKNFPELEKKLFLQGNDAKKLKEKTKINWRKKLKKK